MESVALGLACCKLNCEVAGVLEGVDCGIPAPGLPEAVGLMSVKPSRKADDGAAMVGWALLGCISDIGGFTTDLVEGVRGLVAGDDMMALRLWVGSLTGLSSRSTTDSRVVGGAAMGSGCMARGWCEQWRDLLRASHVCLLTLPPLARRADRRRAMVMEILEVDTRRGSTGLMVSGAMGAVSEGEVARLQAWKGEIVCGMKLSVM